jgi:glyoxylase-like metal-dependent hydrolase (beta-lactamase superfamily II)
VTDPLLLPLGDNTAYALPLAGGGVILVDAGPDIPAFEGAPAAEDGVRGGTWELLVALLAAGGVETSDVRAVLVTHHHLDHAGLAARWAAEGARILAGAADVPALIGGQAWYDARRSARIDALIEHGVPAGLVEQMSSPARRRPPEYRWEPCPLDAIEVVEDGTEFALAGGASLRVLGAPGHTPGNLVAYVEAMGDLYSGDTLLPGTVPTPGLHFADARNDAEGGGAGERLPSLPDFVASVTRLRALDVRRVLPGHGAPVDGEEAERLFVRFERHHERRPALVRTLIEEQPDTAFGLIGRLFPHLPEARIPQAMTELIGQLDVLVSRGEAVAEQRDGLLVHRALARG